MFVLAGFVMKGAVSQCHSIYTLGSTSAQIGHEKGLWIFSTAYADTVSVMVSSDDGYSLDVKTQNKQSDSSWYEATSGIGTMCLRAPSNKCLDSPGPLGVLIWCHAAGSLLNWWPSCNVHCSIQFSTSAATLRPLPAPSPTSSPTPPSSGCCSNQCGGPQNVASSSCIGGLSSCICGSPSSPSSSSSDTNVGLIVGIVIAVVFVIGVVFCLCCMWKMRLHTPVLAMHLPSSSLQQPVVMGQPVMMQQQQPQQPQHEQGAHPLGAQPSHMLGSSLQMAGARSVNDANATTLVAPMGKW